MSAKDDVEMSGIGVDHCLIFKECNNYDEVWGVLSVPDDSGSMASYIPSEVSNEEYAVQVKRDSSMVIFYDHVVKSNGMSSLGTQINIKYSSPSSQQGLVSQAANNNTSSSQQHVSNEDPPLNQSSSSNVFNIELNYDPNQALDPDFWDGNFHMVYLHGSMKNLALDVLNIKESLSRMWKYILDKIIENNGANNIKDFKDMGKSLWEFISTIYNFHWDNLFVDNNQITFRSKVKLKFNPQINKPKISAKGKETVKPIFISTLMPPIPAKSQKEVNEISKFFKKTNSSTLTKFYAQASTTSKKMTSSISSSNITRDILKIKEIFPNLPNKKINLV